MKTFRRATIGFIVKQIFLSPFFLFIVFQSWNDLNQLIKISDSNRDLNQMIFLIKKFSKLNEKTTRLSHICNKI